ncbi:hypothetical protein GCM10028787_27120 [Brachybacterium horti]
MLRGAALHHRATVGPVNRRTALLLTAAALPTVLLAGYDGAPPIEASVADGVLQGDEAWSRVVTFSGSAEQIEAWVEASFPGGIESKAHKDDLAVAVERLGEGVQKKGDRLAEGVEGSTAFVVAVGQEDEPVVHAAVRRTGR